MSKGDETLFEIESNDVYASVEVIRHYDAVTGVPSIRYSVFIDDMGTMVLPENKMFGFVNLLNAAISRVVELEQGGAT